jgi:hypothetical protein
LCSRSAREHAECPALAGFESNGEREHRRRAQEKKKAREARRAEEVRKERKGS